ncbi:MAG TPA: non-ribosomal peptide synthase/polyketide synthase, partial [Thermoanaerobaculia bacterium]|nr:non-ribosomal peptide synthase/polyketide synthase [Thermoanaerobaculia bacterium]
PPGPAATAPPSDLAAELRAALRATLPDYMVPSLIVELPVLPLTPSGKIDRRALPAPEPPRRGGAGHVAPRNPAEELLAALWAELLGLEQVGIEDNFFERGGHSLLATQLMSRVRRAFGVELPLRALFESPTVAGLAARLRPAPGAGGAARAEEAEEDAPPLGPAPRGDAAAAAGPVLSFAQERLWFLEQLEPGVYNMPSPARLVGELDLAALAGALSEIVRRHEALRTGIEERDGRPVARLAPPRPLPLPLVDLSPLPAAARQAAALALARQEAVEPFDLGRPPLLRALLLRHGSGEHWLLLSIHHLASDLWSLGVLLRELSALYEARRAGRPSPLPELALQYSDFAAWQRRWLAGAPLAARLAYWRQALAGAPAALELPTDRPRLARRSPRGGLVSFGLPPERGARIATLARRFEVTPFMFLLAIWDVLLARYSGQTDLLVGTPIANRNRLETEPLIGLFVNTLVLRADLGGDPDLPALLARVRETTLGAFEHQDLPFERLVEELAPARDTARSPLFQVMFVLQNAPLELRLPGLGLALLETAGGTAKFDLTLTIVENIENAENIANGAAGRRARPGLSASLEYASDLFDGATVARMAGHYANLLELVALAAAGGVMPAGPVRELPLLGAAERAQLLVEWNQWTDTMPRGELLHELFERQARRTPAATAVEMAAAGATRPASPDPVSPAAAAAPEWLAPMSPMSYAELEERANDLAAVLRALGVGAEAIVAVALPPSPAAIVALLAVWKAGGAFLPIDAAHPAARRAFMLRDSRARLLLLPAQETAAVAATAGSSPMPQIPQIPQIPPAVRTLRLGPRGEAGLVAGGGLPKEPAAASVASIASIASVAEGPTRAVEPGNLAYLIYTSGSTGEPKPVGVEHGPAAAHVETVRRELGLGSGDRVLQFAALSFDVALEQILPALAGGATLVLRGAMLWSPAELLDRLAELGVTVADLPTAYWQQWVRDLAGAAPRPPERLALRLVTVGGEAMAPDTARLWRTTAAGAARLLNAYGPTEAVITATRFEVGAGERSGAANSSGAAAAAANQSGAASSAAGSLGAAAGAAAWVPIGGPFPCRSAHVVDLFSAARGGGEPLPAGVPGELCLGGLLARGYLGRPELTAARFVPDPFAALPGARLYRTGDLARRRPDGNLEFLGRVDQQVKVRGFRIELGEIEAVLAGHPEVFEAALAVRPFPAPSPNPDTAASGPAAPAEMRLVAYVVRRRHRDDSEQRSAAELRAYLGERLPDPMLPAAFVFLGSLPLTAAGKVDRRALPEPDAAALAAARPPGSGDATAADGRHAPHTPVEELLCGIWANLLGLPSVGVRDNFFALGGHSLLATQLVSRVRAALGVELPVAALFENPTVAALAAFLERAGRGELPPPLLRAPRATQAERGAHLPLSFAQQRLWFLEQLEPGSAFYNLPSAVQLQGRLELPALAAALAALVRRHEALRTSFDEREGRPYQTIAPAAAHEAAALAGAGPSRPLLPLVDLGSLPAAARRDAAGRLAALEARRPFDLRRGPLLRATLLRLAPAEHQLLLTLHHIISDGWSDGILVAELAALYEAAVAGRPARLAELPVQYADYALWQRQWLQGEALSRQLDYWRRQLAFLGNLDLPFDRPRPAVARFRGAQRPIAVLPDLAARLNAVARARGVTLFMVLLASFQALLSRLTGQTDVPVGTPVANRGRPEIEGIIGFFVNTLVLRGDLSGDPDFAELLLRVRATALAAYAHQDIPFEQLVQELQPERDLSRNPLFHVMLALQNQPRPTPGDIELGGLRISQLALDNATAKFDLTFFWREEEGGLSGLCELDTDLFDPATALRFARHYETLLGAAAREPHRPLATLQLLAAPERQQLLVEWNAGGAPAVSGTSFVERVARQAAQTPDAVAVAWSGGGTLTYGGLVRAARRLAARLRAQGAGPGALVAICAERSPEMVVAVLGVLEAGAAYLPLDPAYPAERQAFMLEDSRAAWVLTQRRLAAALPAGAAAVLCLDGEDGLLAAGGGEEKPGNDLKLSRGASPDDLAYVIYTSGSTGRPKGVAMTRGVLANLLDWQEASSPLAGPVRTLQLASLSFDVSFQEIFSTWRTGGTLQLIGEETRRDPFALLDLLESERIERLFLPFVALRQLAEAAAERLTEDGAAPGPASLREIITAGEQLQITAAVAAWLARLSGCRLVNQYGPSESHVVTAWVLAGPSAGWPALPPIGRPIAGCRIYLLDRAGEPVPPGVVGELCIGGLGGAGLARGYLDRPRLTAERFVPDPFAALSGEPGGRLYRTGDLARYRPDGAIEFLGRADQQVKVRGFRIEPGEIEAALAAHPLLAGAAVVAHRDASGEQRLFAYVVPAAAPADHAAIPATDHGALRAYLLERLPEYMVPSLWVTLPALPQTPSGKIDRRALPVPDPGAWRGAGRGRWRRTAAPRTPAEELLVAIWAEVLELDPVEMGVDDNFFALGGHSLLATQLVSRVRSAFGVELPLRTLFESPTVAAMAAALESRRAAAAASLAAPAPAPPPLQAVARPDEIPLSFAQERLWFIDRLDPGSAAYTIPAAVCLVGQLELPALAAALDGIVRRHEALRTVFQEVGGRPAQRVMPPRRLSLPRVDLLALPEGRRREVAAELVRAEVGRGFDLASGPLLRVTLVRLGGREHLVLLNVHHIVWDGWSLGIFVGELGAIYRNALSALGGNALSAAGPKALPAGGGEPGELPALPLQYADFALWQRRWLCGERLASLVAFWRQSLAGAPRLLELPTDRPRTARRSLRGGSRALALPAPLVAELRALARREGATPFMVLLAAFGALLARLSGQSDLLLGSPIANRNRLETEGLIGFFVNTLVLRLETSAAPTLLRLVRQARETTLASYAHQDLPFEKLVEELEVERSLAHNPLFQVVLSLLNEPMPPLALPGLELIVEEVPESVAKFDLTLAVAASPDGLTALLNYASDIFDGATAARWLSHFAALLGGAVADPGASFEELPLLGPGERQQLLHEWNDTARQGAAPWASAPALVAAAAARAPAALAVAGGAVSLSYGELVQRADLLARWLVARGVGPDVLVATCLERSPELVVAVLACLQAGGAYLALDPDHPRERLAWQLADAWGGDAPRGRARPRLLLTHSQLAGRLPEAERGVEVLFVDRFDELAMEAAGGWAGGLDRALPEATAYVIYTSGSTGRPKGVAVSHRALRSLIDWHHEVYGLASADRATLVASPAFDAAVWEVWPYLAAGASLHVPDAETRSAPARLTAWLAARRITVSFLPTPLAEGVLAESWPPETALRALLTGGDRLHRGAPASFPAVLYNHYGPTEATVVATSCPVAERQELPPIGRPIANTRLYLADRRGGLAPRGVAGELWIGGAGLARGYFGRPLETAEKFVPDPWSGEPGARLYRTGDLGRCLPDGQIEFLGRLDSQVKVRGYRIELGEVEAVLATHPAVREAAAAVHEAAGDRRLVGYLVAADDEPPPLSELRGFLMQRLPEPMIPAAFMILPALPLTASGKLDRRALPAPDWGQAGAAAADEAPRTPVEELVAGVWQEVLGVERVGVKASFFELGGHSLLATRLVARLREVTGLELPLRALFETPTVEGVAAALERAAGAAAAPPLLRVSRDGDLPLSFSQQRLWFLEQLQPGSAFYNLPSALRLEGRLEPAALAAALASLVRRHEALRTTFGEREGRPYQRIEPPLPRGGPRLGDRTTALPLVDLGALPAVVREAAAAALAVAEARRPFDLGRGPLLRSTLLRLGRREHVLLLTLHHIVSDGWSDGILSSELAILYEAASAGQAAALPELPVQYADYAVWQRQWLRGEELERQLVYWRERLAGVPALDLPFDRPRPSVESFRGGLQQSMLSPELAAALAALSRRSGVTLYMTLLAAFQALLLRLTGQTDLPVGTPVANRGRPEVFGVIGFFANTLVLRGELAGEPDRDELLRRTRAVALGAYAHQDLPFEKLVEELQPERDLSRNPLFQVMCVLQNQPRAAVELAELRFSSLALDNQTAKFDLSFFWQEHGGALHGLCEFNSDLFDAATARRLAGHYETLLAALPGAAPGEPVAALPVLRPGERQQLLAEWNASGPAQTSGCDFIRRVREQAARTPEAPAIVFGERHEQQWSYGELVSWSSRLARRLARRGVGPGSLVAICAERSPEMVGAVLAVLEAGAAYLPVDPAYPAERRNFMLRDSGAAWVLTQPQLASRLPEERVLILPGGTDPEHSERSERSERSEHCDEPPRRGADPLGLGLAEPGNDLGRRASPDDLAYVIYTSGSTGRPKGVAMTRGALSNLLAWQEASSPLTGPVRTLQYASLSFDVSFQEIFSTWRSGGALVLVSEQERHDPEALLALLEEQRIERLFLPFVALRQLAEAAQAVAARPAAAVAVVAVAAAGAAAARPATSLPGRLREVITAGEQLQVTAAIAAWFARLPDCRLHNQYGPTETHVVTAYALEGPVARWPALPPIGRPVAGCRIHLLDRALEPAPVGVPGELHIGGENGVSLARGYLGRPRLTAERFVPDPFAALWGEPGGRLYRTGDLARYRPDGAIDFLGRADQQVKVRGYRIELGEIEAVLGAHPAIAGAAVAALRDGAGEQRLAAFVVHAPAPPPAPQTIELRRYLAERLPDYMVPSLFVALPALPLTPSGKLDRRALPLLTALSRGAASGAPFGAAAKTAPRNPIEEVLAGIWAEVLELDAAGLGVDDNFFDLGGHSLLATQLVSRVRSAFGIELAIRRLFEAPTVACLALEVSKARRGGDAFAPSEGLPPPPPLLPRPAPRRRGAAPATAGDGLGEPEGPLPLSFAQERLWFLEQFEPGGSLFNMPAAARLRGTLDRRAFAAAVDEVLRRHEALRTYFVVGEAGSPRQVVAPWRPRGVPAVDLAALPGARREAEAARLAEAEAVRPFDLTAGPLLRAAFVPLAADEHVVLLTMHHIASDGWSWSLLLREIAALYEAFSAGRPSPLPELPIQYADYALWQRAWLTGAALEAQLAYWRQALSGPLGQPAPLELPADRPRPAVQTFRGGELELVFSAELGAALRMLARRRGASLFMVLLAGAAALFARWSGQDDVVVGAPIAGRTRAETEGLIGFFLNTLVLRTDLSGDPGFADLLARVRETTLSAYAHQELPFEKLLEELRPERDLSRTPLFQVLFNMVNVPDRALRLPALSVEGLGSPELLQSKFDMTFYWRESEGRTALRLVYNADLFDAPRMTEMARQLESVLRQAAADPERPLSSLSLLTPEAAALLPNPAAPLSDAWEGPIQRLLACQARRLPDKVAIADPAESWSYRDLDEGCNRLARFLRAGGVGRGDVVAIYAHRSAPLVRAVLGALRAGGVALILDPAYPPRRLVELLELSAPRALLAVEAAGALPPELEQAAAGLPCRLRLAGRAAERSRPGPLAAFPGTDPDVEVGPNDAAVLTFTSGSSGVPKGVVGRHGPLTHFVPWMQASFALDEHDRWSLLSGLAHDPLQRDIFTPLQLGATLCIPDPRDIFAAGRLAEWMRRSALTVANLTPAMAQLLTEAPPGGLPSEVPSLRYAFLVGDLLTWNDVSRLRRMAPGVTCVNLYGATETQRAIGYHVVPSAETAKTKLVRAPGEGASPSPPAPPGRDPAASDNREGDRGVSGGDPIDASSRHPPPHRSVVSSRELVRRQVLPLGRGMGDAQLLVLSRAGALAGIGELGEIAVRSPHLARGYLAAPAATAERFVPDPFGDPSGNRIYLTGDLGRYRPDGEVELVARADQQVKIRGFRIELGEIEAALLRHPGLREVAVIARPAAEGGLKLIAYYVAASEPTPAAAELQEMLRQRLPEQMVPASWVELRRLPLTPNGKLDRRALPEPLAARGERLGSAAGVLPRGALEQLVAEIWGEILGVERLGAHESFFMLGGHSLLATQVVARLGAVLGIEVPVRSLFEASTVAGLAENLSRQAGPDRDLESAARLALDLLRLTDEQVESLLAQRAGGAAPGEPS